MRRAQAPLHMQSWHAWFTEGAQSCGIYRCVAPLYRPPSHASSLKAGKSQSLVTQLKRSLGDRLCKESFQFSNFTASSEALVHLDFILTNAWNTDCVQPPLWTCSRMDWLWPRLYLLKTKWTHSCLFCMTPHHALLLPPNASLAEPQAGGWSQTMGTRGQDEPGKGRNAPEDIVGLRHLYSLCLTRNCYQKGI